MCVCLSLSVCARVCVCVGGCGWVGGWACVCVCVYLFVCVCQDIVTCFTLRCGLLRWVKSGCSVKLPGAMKGLLDRE